MGFFDNDHWTGSDNSGVPDPTGPVSGSRPGPTEGVHGKMAQHDPGKTTLGKGCHINGKLSFDGTVHIDGNVEGEITAQDSVLIGETAVVNAQVVAESVVITGKVVGDVSARRHLELKAPGQMFGNISTPSLVMHDGVVFEGHCSMNGSRRKDATGLPAQAKKGRDTDGVAVPPSTKTVADAEVPKK